MVPFAHIITGISFAFSIIIIIIDLTTLFSYAEMADWTRGQ
jgi:hypothetical protein